MQYVRSIAYADFDYTIIKPGEDRGRRSGRILGGNVRELASVGGRGGLRIDEFARVSQSSPDTYKRPLKQKNLKKIKKALDKLPKVC